LLAARTYDTPDDVVAADAESRRVGLAVAALIIAVAGCVDDNIPPRPSVGSSSAIQLVNAPGCGSLDLAVRDDTLFWTDKAKGTVKSIPTAGGATTTLASNQMMPGPIVADAVAAYWVANNAKVIATKPRVGGSVKVLVAASATPEIFGDENDINALLVNDGTLYFSRFTFALKIPTAGGVMPTVIGHSPETDLGRPGAFALDSAHLYQTEIFHRAVSRETVDGMQVGLLEDGMTKHPFAPDRIAVSQGSLLVDAIAVWNGNVIWANGPTILSKPVGESEHAAAVGVTSTNHGDDVTGFVVSDGVVYFGESGGNTIQKAPLSGGQPTVFAANQLNARRFAADATSIYWLADDCAIMKLAK
jgi:hypothetical protein